MATQWLVLLATGAVVIVVAYSRKQARRHLPPGPRPLPLVGNVLDFPTKHLGREFRELSLKHGDVVYLQVLGQEIVLLGSYQAACDILEKRSGIYSNRPESVMVKLTNLDWIFVFQNHTMEWRRYRKAFHTSFMSSVLPRYHSIQAQVGAHLLNNLLDTPEKFSSHIKFAFAAVVLRVVYGVDLVHGDTRHYGLVQELAEIAESISTPGKHPVEAFPSMQGLPSWAPGAGFQKLAQKWKKEIAHIRDELFDTARDRMKESGIKESVLTRLVESGEDEELVRNLAATMYAAGADTTNSSVHAFVLAMAKFPEAQKKAQEELDRVIGPDRLPQFADLPSLPYMYALIREVMRWHVVAPIGVPHRAEQDDEYNGYLIPAGAIVMANQWAMSRDEMMYPDPETFEPERFIEGGRLHTEGILDPFDYAFGFGRRVCPGKAFAECSFFVFAAYILHTLHISPPLDENGKPKELDVYMGNALAVSHPDPFQCRIVPRDTRRVELIRAAAFSP